MSIFHQNFEDFQVENSYDLFLANPPYFQEGEGRISPDQRRQSARTFTHISKQNFLEKLIELKPQIRFLYFLMRGQIDNENFKPCKEISTGTYIYQLT